MVHGGYTMIGQTKDKPIRRRGIPTAQVQRDALMKTKNKEKTQGNTNRHPEAKHKKTRKVKKKKKPREPEGLQRKTVLKLID